MSWFKDYERHRLSALGIKTSKYSHTLGSRGSLKSGIRYEKNAELEGATLFHSRESPRRKEEIAIYNPDNDITYFFEKYDVSPVPDEDLLAGNGFDKVFEMPYGEYGILSKEIWVGWMDKDLDRVKYPRFFIAVRVPYEGKNFRTKSYRYYSRIDDWGPEKILGEDRNMAEWKKIPSTEE